METTLEIEKFIQNNDDDIVADYLKTLTDNLKELNVKEEKHNQWLLIMVLLFFILSNTSIESISLGPISLKDISIIGKILPMIFIFVLFNLRTISEQKKDTTEALKLLAQKRFRQTNSTEVQNIMRVSLITRLYLPHSFVISIIKLFEKKPSVSESFIGFILFIPVIIIASAPYIIIVLMIIDLYKIYLNDTFGKLCFGLTIWLFLVMLFYIIKSSVNKRKVQ